MPTITFVKKILKDGQPCPKCRQVEQRLIESSYMNQIDHVVIADERDLESEGMRLANTLQIDRAPFFVVKDGDETRTYTVYFRFIKDELESSDTQSVEDVQDTLRSNPDLDAI